MKPLSIAYFEGMKKLIISIAVIVATAFPASADKVSLSNVSKYLNSFETAKAEFTQINADGTVTTGDVLIKRPGRVRFDYDAPDNSLVIAGGGQVAVFDPKSNVPPQQFPLSRTPLGLILAKNVNLSQGKMVVGHGTDGPATVVRMQDPKNPDYGSIELKFTDKPVELRQWVIRDNTGAQTTVILGDLKTGVQIGARPFSIVQEVNDRGLN